MLAAIRRIFAFSLVCCALAAPAVAAEKRLALIIANKTYIHLPQLANTISDSRLIAEKLRADGFDVDLREDVGKDALGRAFRDFGRRIQDARNAGDNPVALVYYAGHGVQDDRQLNYLIGVDADVRNQVDLPVEALSLDALRQTLEQAGPRIAFIILDACRDSLIASSKRGAARGLGLETASSGSMIVFSTAPGKAADDGPPGGRSPFADAFARALETQGLEATPLFRQVQLKTLDATRNKGEQFPYVAQQLTEDFYFRPGPQAAIVESRPQPAAAPASGGSGSLGEGEIAYGRVVLVNTSEAYDDWLRKYSDHPRKPNVMLLLQRLREEALWRQAEQAGSTDEKIRKYELIRLAFPDGVYAAKAEQRIAALQLPPPVVAPRPPEPPPAVQPLRIFRHANSDAPGGDRGQWLQNVADVDDCERLCVNDLSCVGYTYNIKRSVCIRKARIDRLVRAPEAAITGVIADRAGDVAVAAPAPRIRRYADRDAPGHDRGSWIRGVSSEDCERICLADTGCAGYTYNRRRSTCIPKSDIFRLAPAAEAAVTGIVDRSN